MRVKPTNPDAVIRDPHTCRVLPKDGGDVPDSPFWRRRVRDGDVKVLRDGPTGLEPVTPLTTREHTERHGDPDAGGDDR